MRYFLIICLLLTSTTWAEQDCSLYGINELTARKEEGPPDSCTDGYLRIIKRAYMAVREYNNFNNCIDTNGNHLNQTCLEHNRASILAIKNLFHTDLINFYGENCIDQDD